MKLPALVSIVLQMKGRGFRALQGYLFKTFNKLWQTVALIVCISDIDTADKSKGEAVDEEEEALDAGRHQNPVRGDPPARLAVRHQL